MRTLLTRGLAALVVAGSLAAVTPVAHAETVVVRDARGDVKRVVDTGGRTKLSPAPRERTTDITRLAVRHGWKRVSVAIDLRRLDPDAEPFLEIGLALPGKASASVIVFPADGRWQTFAVVHRFGESRLCKAWTAARPARDRVVVTVPRRCLGRPDWVRTNVLMVTFAGPDDGGIAYLDAVHRSTAIREEPTSFGPKVLVG